jgi:DNA replication and repair protein RecF
MGMQLTHLQLRDFRTYGEWSLHITKPVTVLVGDNAAGKSNVIEAIHLLATGESFRADTIEEMVGWGKELGHVVGEVVREGEIKADRLRVTVTVGRVQGKRTAKRRYLVNEVAKRKVDFVGRLAVVLFEPDTTSLITGSPSRRRMFLDRVLVQADREYARSLQAYEKGLRRRNKLLDLITEGKSKPTALAFWDDLLVREGAVIHEKRTDLISYIVAETILGEQRMIQYQPSVITEEKLEQNRAKEIMLGYTLSGPHKDDFIVQAQGSGGNLRVWRDLAKYGSRGEQRMASLWLKIGELAFLERALGERPVLLLDDVFSELDREHESLVMDLVTRQQSVVATTETNGLFTKSTQRVVIERS